MRKNFGVKNWLYPMPVFIVGTYDENGNPNAMNAAWGTVCDTAQVVICLDKSHKTTQNLLKSKCFTVSIADSKNVVFADYVGVVSANDEPNKLVKTGWTAVKGECVNAPIFNELPLALECKLISYDVETELLIGEVVNVSAHEEILNSKDKIDLEKFKPICYDTDGHGYYTLGEKVGTAFFDGLKLK